ncbi:hypothetical protein KIW84_073205, partial [Lathyrus oleraceus]
NARSICNMYVCSSSINSLETVHNQLLFQLNNHVPLEHNPKWPILDNSVTQSSRPWVNRVVVSRVSDNIELSIATTDSISSKTNTTICQTLPILLPIGEGKQ